MNALDIALLAIVTVAAIIGAVKGLIRQIGVIAGVILGVVLALKYGGALSGHLAVHIHSEQARNILAPFLIFLVVYLMVIIVASMVHSILHKIRLGWMNRAAGAFFGGLSAAVPLGAVLLLVVAYVPPGRPYVAESPVAFHMMRWSETLLSLMPEEAKSAFDRGKKEVLDLLKGYKELPQLESEAVTEVAGVPSAYCSNHILRGQAWGLL